MRLAINLVAEQRQRPLHAGFAAGHRGVKQRPATKTNRAPSAMVRSAKWKRSFWAGISTETA
jgi:hypothetical protein